jgi:hypothetical protein
MSFNKRWVTLDRCVSALKEGKLKEYYGNSETLVFEDTTCSLIYNLHLKGKTDEEILNQLSYKNENHESKFN